MNSIKVLTAITSEIDEPSVAVAEVLSQLELGKNQRKYSCGIIHCYSEAIETGVIKALSDALPFVTVGTTTTFNSSCGVHETVQITVTVLTSDTAQFFGGVTESYANYTGNPAIKAFNSVKATAGEAIGKPVYALIYAPLMQTCGGDEIIRSFDKATGAIPLFGTVTVDHLSTYETSQTILNGKAYATNAAFVAVYNAPLPTMRIISVDFTKVKRSKAIITSSERNVLKTINGIPAIDYLEQAGYPRDLMKAGTGGAPILIDYCDGSEPIARTVFGTTPEEYIFSGGDIQEGGAISVGILNADEVTTTAENLLKLIEADKHAGLLMYSCLARYLTLGDKKASEAERVNKVTNGAPYAYAVSGGEICPQKDGKGVWHNRFHNFTLVVCEF